MGIRWDTEWVLGGGMCVAGLVVNGGGGAIGREQQTIISLPSDSHSFLDILYFSSAFILYCTCHLSIRSRLA